MRSTDVLDEKIMHSEMRTARVGVAALLLVLACCAETVRAGPVAAGICYAGCGGLVTACFAAAGFTFGTVPGAVIGAVPALTLCNTAFAACEAACMAALFTPTI